MKYIYILGLEHSGTTLTDYLVSGLPNAIGLGEIHSYFDPKHMQNYMAQWGDQPDVTLCSCMQEWDDCKFWSGLQNLNGLNSNAPMAEKYRHLFDYVRGKYSDQAIVVDSSKRLDVLEMIATNTKIYGLSNNDMHVIFTFKDPREFSMSISKKQDKNTIIDILKSFNWWHGETKKMMQFLNDTNLNYSLNSYQSLCQNHEVLISEISAAFGLSKSDVAEPNSHIAMGNKSFSIRNKETVRYDDRWKKSLTIRVANFLHVLARRQYKILISTTR